MTADTKIKRELVAPAELRAVPSSYPTKLPTFHVAALDHRRAVLRESEVRMSQIGSQYGPLGIRFRGGYDAMSNIFYLDIEPTEGLELALKIAQADIDNHLRRRRLFCEIAVELASHDAKKRRKARRRLKQELTPGGKK